MGYRSLESIVSKTLKIYVVIPCKAEKEIVRAVRSLFDYSGEIEVHIIVVVNALINESAEIHAINNQSVANLSDLMPQLLGTFSLEIMQEVFTDFNKAGVGLARKTGMDRAASMSSDRDIILCFDADCQATPNYLHNIHSAFKSENCDCAALGFRHENLFVNRNILEYELFLRFYSIGLKLAAYPFWHQTIGSCMAVSAAVYRKYGGMNTRKAGEDFYFMHKLMPVSKTISISNAINILSDRESDKVPFGTGKAMGEARRFKNQERFVYHPNAFDELQSFIEQFSKDPLFILTGDSTFHQYLRDEGCVEGIRNLFRNFGSNEYALRKAIWQYLNGFRILRYFHWYRDKIQSNIPVSKALNIKFGNGTPEIWHAKLVQLEQL